MMVTALLVSVTSCKEEKKETTVIEETIEVVEETANDAADAVEDAAEEVSETVTEAVENVEADAKDVLDEESVTVTYSRMINGMEVKAKKSFKGSQEKVEALVKAFEDSLKKLDPNIKIINE